MYENHLFDSSNLIQQIESDTQSIMLMAHRGFRKEKEKKQTNLANQSEYSQSHKKTKIHFNSKKLMLTTNSGT